MLKDSLSLRRSIYALDADTVLSDEDIIKQVEQCIKHCPTAFNSQSARVVILFAEKHKQFWQMVKAAIEKVSPSDRLEAAVKRLNNFANGKGTILFFEDQAVLTQMQQKFALYAKSMWDWNQQSNAILQYMIWQVLAENNIGASLQHYGNLLEDELYKQFNLPQTWKIMAQMPFGKIKEPAAEKTFEPLENRLKVLW